MHPLETLFLSLERLRASDLFLAEGRPPAVRVDGKIQVLERPPTTRDELRWLVERVIPTNHGRASFEERGDWDAGLHFPSGERFRVNIARQQGLLSSVIRTLPRGEKSFADLNVPDYIRTWCDQPRGLILVTGATGSGKSTTLAAMIHHMNVHRRAHIVTIEDPVEFVHLDINSRVTQREIGTDTPDFGSALRQVVRQSPDVILVGEIRDMETMGVALSASLTGHLVLATLHTIDATQTLQRILSFFPEDARQQVALDLSLALRGVLSQRLLPRADGTGRVVAVEMLTMGPACARVLRDQQTDLLSDLMRADAGPGMVTFNESLLALYKAGTITHEVGVAYASNPDEFALWAKGMATSVDSFRGPSENGDLGVFDMKALLQAAIQAEASDIHVAVGRPPILRVSGHLRPIGKNRLTDADVRTLLFSIMSQRQRTTYELEREVDFALAMDDGKRFRVNAYFQKGRMAAAMRAIATSVPDAQTLRIPQPILALGEKPQGLVLVVGPTGSGKSTTLACLIDRINRTRACRIITVEDPIEYVHPSRLATIDQREVNADTKSFASALKYVLRQDPDVILVGEMRDLETIHAALTAAETGHLVFATLHTNDAIQAIDRIIDVFPPAQQAQVRTQLSSALLGIVSQRLLPKRGGGRIAAYEVMIATSAIKNLIREAKMHQALGIMEASSRDGCQTLDQHVQQLFNDGLIMADEAVRYLRNGKLGSNQGLPGPQRF